MKILLIGKNGQLGNQLSVTLPEEGTVVALDRRECDLTSPKQLREKIQQLRPDIIINAAAYTAVDRAEDEAQIAMQVNAVAVGIIGEEAKKLDALVIHYSTDYLFNGEKSSPYLETDRPAPQNVYGESKWLGEQALIESGARYLIFRTTWVHGPQGSNFLKTILHLASSRDILKIVADQYGVPTSTQLLASATLHVLRSYSSAKNQNKEASFPYGIYHLTPEGQTNWYEYARYIVAKAVKEGVPLTLTSEQIFPIPTEEYPLPAKRPKNSRLDCSLFKKTFGFSLPDWQNDVDSTLNQLLSEKK